MCTEKKKVLEIRITEPFRCAEDATEDEKKEFALGLARLAKEFQRVAKEIREHGHPL